MGELEAQVLAEWCRDRRAAWLGASRDRQALQALLDVLGDQLQEQGDPRGDVIALHHGRQATGDAIGRWLGVLLSVERTVTVGAGVVHLDFSDPRECERACEVLRQVLSSPGASYIANLRIFGSIPQITHALDLLASCVHPWLTMILLKTSDDGDAIADDVIDRVIQMTPNLSYLGIRGDGLLRDFPHPALCALDSSADEIAALGGRGRAFPGLVKLRLFGPVANHVDLLPTTTIPTLRFLELPDRSSQTFALFERQAARHALTRAALPMIMTVADADCLTRALTTLPHLERLVVAANYGDAREFAHATAKLEIPTYRPGAKT